MSNEAEIAKLMKTLSCTREEALDIIRADKEIDQGKRVEFDLSPEEEKRAKKYANADTHKKPITFTKRERKPDEEKEAIIAEISRFIDYSIGFPTENVEIVNKNRQIRFSIGDNWYDLTLVKKNPNKFKPKGDE